MKIKKILSLLDYCYIVENIAQEYFDDNNEYTPHYGKLNVMRLFYNYCIIDDIADLPHDFTEAEQVETLVTNSEFISEFDRAIQREDDSYLTFSNAYHTAMDIVDNKKNNVRLVIDMLKEVIGGLLDNITNVLSQENIDKFTQIAKEISDGRLSEESVVEAVENSDTFKQIISDKEAE